MTSLSKRLAHLIRTKLHAWQSDEAKQAYEAVVDEPWNPVVSGIPVDPPPMQKLTGEEAKAFLEARGIEHE